MKQSPLHHCGRFHFTQILFVLIFLAYFVFPGYSQALPPGSPEYDTMNEISRLRSKLLKNPDDAKAWFQIGRKYERLKEWGESITAYETAIRKRTTYGDAWLWLGWAYIRVNNEAEALKVFDELTAIPSHAADAHAGMGWIYYSQGQYTKALAAYKQAIQSRPNFAGVIYEIARIHLAMNDAEAARAQHATLTKIDPLLANFLQGEIKRKEKPDAASSATKSQNIESQAITSSSDELGRKPYLMIYENTKLPPSFKNFEMNGEVKLNVVINPDGSAVFIKPVSELPFGLTEIAIEAIEKFQFQPAIKLGKPVPTKMVFTYVFWLD